MHKRKNAFTLIELLVVISLIAALVGILAVAQKKVKMVARNLRQKAEFHGMEISIELFSNDFRDYPDSSTVTEGTQVCGGQRLAEAMVGRDEEGFHPKSKWHPDKEAAETPPLVLYDNDTVDTSKERKPLYFELKHTGLYTLEDLWGAGVAGTLQDTDSPIFTDVFNFNRVTDASGDTFKVGSPVLYFKADSTKEFRVSANTRTLEENPDSNTYKSWVYNLDDNIEILELPWLRDPAVDTDNAISPHYDEDRPTGITTAAGMFYELLTHRRDDDRGFYKPYNPSTFILISAGWDGIYGTKDDVTNFDY